MTLRLIFILPKQESSTLDNRSLHKKAPTNAKDSLLDFLLDAHSASIFTTTVNTF